MAQRATLVMLSAAAAVFASRISTSPRPATVEAPSDERAAAVQFVGHASKVTTPRFVLIKDEPAWATLWAEHTGVAAGLGPPTRHAAPKIDFSRFMVVGTFQGAMTNSDGAVALGVVTGTDAVRIRYELSTFQTASFGPGGDPGVSTTPFGLWVIEKTDRPVVIEEGTRGLKDQPVEWREVQRLQSR